MAKINVLGDAVVITSDLKAEDITLAAKYNPKALTLVDEDGDPYFGIAVSNKSSINAFGISFNGVARDGSGKATVTIGYNGSDKPDEIKEDLADKFGIALANLNKIEKALPAVLADIQKQKKTVIESITVG